MKVACIGQSSGGPKGRCWSLIPLVVTLWEIRSNFMEVNGNASLCKWKQNYTHVVEGVSMLCRVQGILKRKVPLFFKITMPFSSLAARSNEWMVIPTLHSDLIRCEHKWDVRGVSDFLYEQYENIDIKIFCCKITTTSETPFRLPPLNFFSHLFWFLGPYVANFLSFQRALFHLKSEYILFITMNTGGKKDITKVSVPLNI